MLGLKQYRLKRCYGFCWKVAMTEEQLAVLCIDDDPYMLRALQRLLRRLRPNWQVHCESQIGQLDFTKLPPFALVISDYLMPDMNGDKVLMAFQQSRPECVRVLLTGDTNTILPQHTHKYAHFLIAKPFSQEAFLHLFSAIDRLQQLPFNHACRHQLGGLIDIPIPDQLIKDLQANINSSHCTIDDLAHIVSQDPVLAAKIIQMANSAYFGYQRHTDSLSEAVARLGAKLVESIALSLLVNNLHPTKIQQEISERAYRSSALSRSIAKQLGFSHEEQDKVFIVNLLSCLGKIFLLTKGAQVSQFSDYYQLQPGFADSEVISAFMLIIWGYDTELGDLILSQSRASWEGTRMEQLAYISNLANDLQQHALADWPNRIAQEPELIQNILQKHLAQEVGT